MSTLSQETQEYLYHCNKCGLCMANCPVYQEVLMEWASPRGKVQLIKHIVEGDLELTERMREILSECLLCGSCVAVCPSGVQGDHLFTGMRTEAVAKYGLGWKKRLIFEVLSRKWLTDGSSRMARWSQGLLSKALPLPISPAFNKKPFASNCPEVIDPDGEATADIVYFHGCATNYLNDQVGRSVIRVLKSMGCRVRIPKGQGCCAMPLMVSGATEMAVPIMVDLLKTLSLEGIDSVLVDCATCGSAFKKEYFHIFKEMLARQKQVSEDLGVKEEFIGMSEALAAKTIDVMAFIYEHRERLPLRREAGEKPERVTYHDPCHLLKAQGVGGVVRDLLKMLPNVEYVEMEKADACCGGGGSFQFEHPDISNSIAEKKIESILKTGASTLATGCPGCRMTIQAHLDQKASVKVLHPVQLVEMALDQH